MPISKSHRTVLFLDGSALRDNSTYRERALRLAESLNGKNIKVDVHTVFNGGSVGAGDGIVPGVVTDAPSTSGFDASALHSLAKENGYDQVLISLP